MGFVYVVIQEGVYRHSVLGAFPGDEAGLAQALECGRRGIEAEEDHYHDALILRVPLGPSDQPEETVETLRWLPDGSLAMKCDGPGRVVTLAEYQAEKKEKRRQEDERRRQVAQARIDARMKQ